MSATVLWLLIAALIALNLYAFGLFAWDKRAARLGRRRISENMLLGVALAGGSLGARLAQQWLRHKSSKRSFVWRLNAIIVVHLVLIAGVVWAVWFR